MIAGGEIAMAQEEVQVNPQMAVSQLSEFDINNNNNNNTMGPTPPTKHGHSLLQFALVLQNTETLDQKMFSISHPISLCSVSICVILEETVLQQSAAREWLRLSGISNYESITILYGNDGFQGMLSMEDEVDAVFVIAHVSDRIQHECVMSCLRARKHVLIHDRTSRPLPDFREQLDYARRVNRFVQSSTMFVQHHRVTSFLNCVLVEKFGNITEIEAKLNVNYQDAKFVGVTEMLPAESVADVCIKRLARYCVLISVLLLNRAGSAPVACKIESQTSRKDNQVCSVSGYVLFTGDRMLRFEVGFTSLTLTRQILEVQSHDRYATMTDFVIPHPDGLANYRVYEKAHNPKTGKLEVVGGEALDVLSGPPQGVMMWRRFAQLARAVEQGGYDSPKAAGALELANITIQTKVILLALLKSAETKESRPVPVPCDILG